MINTTLAYVVHVSYESDEPLDESDKQALEAKAQMELEDIYACLSPNNRTIAAYAVEVRRAEVVPQLESEETEHATDD